MAFSTPFFQRFSSTERDLELSPGVVKTYLFPTFYADVTTAMALFLCDHGAAAAQVTDPTLQPIRVGPRTGLVAISTYAYRTVRGMPPYDEAAISVVVTERGAANPPLLGMLRSELHAAVLAMPVTTDENQRRGRAIWGLPKTVERIAHRQRGEQWVTQVSNTDGRQVFELSVPMAGRRRTIEQSTVLRTMLVGHSLWSRATSTGTFATRFDLRGLTRSGPPALTLGDSPDAEPIRALRLHPVPLITRFADDVQSAFTLPLP